MFVVGMKLYLYGIEQDGTAICKLVSEGGREKVERMGKVSTRQAQKLVPVYEHKKMSQPF